MESDKSYQQLLKKMIIIELTGEKLYDALSSKVQNKDLKSTYQRLAQSENQTARFIEKEFLGIYKNSHKITLKLAKFAFNILTVRQLTWILKNILKRQVYSRWFNLHKDNNREFWNRILNHENLQHELLEPFWNEFKEVRS